MNGIPALKALREHAWIPTKHGEQFALHFDDTLYLQLIAHHILDEAEAYTQQKLPELRKRYEQS